MTVYVNPGFGSYEHGVFDGCSYFFKIKGRSKGIAFIDFHKPEDARLATDKNGSIFMQRQIKIDISIPKKKVEF